MLEWIALFCLLGAVALLVALSIIDAKTRLLPNELVLGFATLGLVFHLTTLGTYQSLENIMLGGIMGFGSLYVLRAIANRVYGTDALGLGDVKLIGAAGLWLGPEGVMIALTIGAMAALIHGVLHAVIQRRIQGAFPDLSTLQIPAGPGFAVGIIIAGIYKFHVFTLMPHTL